MRARVPVLACSLCGPAWRRSPAGARARFVRPGLSGFTLSSASCRQIALVSPVRPTHAEKSGVVPVLSEVVDSASGPRSRWVRGLSPVGSGESETATGGLGVGLPWTPPVAALATVPATMSMAPAMRTIRSGFIGSISAERPTNAIGQTANSGPRWGTTQGAKSNAGSNGAGSGGDQKRRIDTLCRCARNRPR
mgnify:CR=1 FL=1